jgi:hypothetical protein
MQVRIPAQVTVSVPCRSRRARRGAVRPGAGSQSYSAWELLEEDTGNFVVLAYALERSDVVHHRLPVMQRRGTESDFCCSPWTRSGHHGDLRSCFYLLCISLGIGVASVLFEVFLRKAVEGECSNGAFQTRSCHSPCTAGAAPAVEIVAVDPNEALVHGHLPFL